MINKVFKLVKKIIGKEETMDISSLRKYITTEKPIIIEAGASDGQDTVKLATMFPEGTIYAFEPIPEAYQKLLKATQSFNNVVTFEKALGKHSGKEEIHVSSNNSSSSLLKPKDHLTAHPEISFESKIEIDVINLDEFMSSQNLDRIDFMWLDLQGLEHTVLSSAPQALKLLKLLYTEVSLIETYKGVMLYPDFNKWMILQNFSLEKDWLPWKDMGNALYKIKD